MITPFFQFVHIVRSIHVDAVIQFSNFGTPSNIGFNTTIAQVGDIYTGCVISGKDRRNAGATNHTGGETIVPIKFSRQLVVE